MTKKSKITFVRADSNAMDYYRLFLPAKALEARGWPVVYEDPSFEDFAWADILVFQRQRKEAAVREIERWRQKGKKIVIDFDDDLFRVDDSSPVKALYDAEALKWVSASAGAADAVTVTTPALAKSLARLNGRIAVLPNSIDEKELARASVHGRSTLSRDDLRFRRGSVPA